MVCLYKLLILDKKNILAQSVMKLKQNRIEDKWHFNFNSLCSSSIQKIIDCRSIEMYVKI